MVDSKPALVVFYLTLLRHISGLLLYSALILRSIGSTVPRPRWTPTTRSRRWLRIVRRFKPQSKTTPEMFIFSALPSSWSFSPMEPLRIWRVPSTRWVFVLCFALPSWNFCYSMFGLAVCWENRPRSKILYLVLDILVIFSQFYFWESWKNGKQKVVNLVMF